MKTKFLSLAVVAFVLSVGTAFAEPPGRVAAADTPGIAYYGLTDSGMLAVTGGTFQSDVCTSVAGGIGGTAMLVGRFLANHHLHLSGAILQGIAPAVCA